MILESPDDTSTSTKALVQQGMCLLQRQNPLTPELPRLHMPESCFGANKLEHTLETLEPYGVILGPNIDTNSEH